MPTTDRDGAPETDEHVQELADAHGAIEAVESDIDAADESTVRRVAEAYDRATALLDRYEETATGSGRSVFESYLEFQEEFTSFVESLDDDLPRREAFDAALDAIDKRRLRERDFEAAREALSPAADLADLLDRREAARTRLREARHDARKHLNDLDDRIEELERVRDFGEADVDAPVAELRDPIAAYNESVEEAFRTFRREASAREVLSFVEATAAYPLVDYRPPPDDLRAYVESAPAGEEPVPTLLEYADYSTSKLDHYVEDVTDFRKSVPVHRTYLERLDAEPLTIGWPPPRAVTLRHRARELVAVVGRFAPESTVAALRRVKRLTRNPEYDRLREAARARAELSERERERLAAGEVAADLERAREARERLSAALDRYTEP